MIVVLKLTTGESFNFKTRKETAQFVGVSLPTLRGWLSSPFYLHGIFILTQTGNGKIEKSKKALAEVQGVSSKDRVNGNHSPRPGESTGVDQPT